MTLKLSEQGPLEKSLQNSVALERQKNMDNRVGIIRGSVQVNTQMLQGISKQKLQKLLSILWNQCLKNSSFCVQLMDQAVKYIEDMQDDFDFRYKTLQSRGETYKTSAQTVKKNSQI